MASAALDAWAAGGRRPAAGGAAGGPAAGSVAHAPAILTLNGQGHFAALQLSAPSPCPVRMRSCACTQGGTKRGSTAGWRFGAGYRVLGRAPEHGRPGWHVGRCLTCLQHYFTTNPHVGTTLGRRPMLHDALSDIDAADTHLYSRSACRRCHWCTTPQTYSSNIKLSAPYNVSASKSFGDSHTKIKAVECPLPPSPRTVWWAGSIEGMAVPDTCRIHALSLLTPLCHLCVLDACGNVCRIRTSPHAPC
eukprot:356055-Chlamydomonas_euryale.AAC.6